MSKPHPMRADDLSLQEEATKLIRDLAVSPPVKAMASVKAATDVLEANLPDQGHGGSARTVMRRVGDGKQRG